MDTTSPCEIIWNYWYNVRRYDYRDMVGQKPKQGHDEKACEEHGKKEEETS